MIPPPFAAVAAALLACLPRPRRVLRHAQKDEIGEIVRDYLLANPELLQEMAKMLEDKQQAAQAEQQKGALQPDAKAIFRSDRDYVAGNPEGRCHHGRVLRLQLRLVQEGLSRSYVASSRRTRTCVSC